MLGESRVMLATAPSSTPATRGNASGTTYIITITTEVALISADYALRRV